MGWFGEQIRERKKSDQQSFEKALLELSDAVTGKNESAVFAGAAGRSKDAVAGILRYYHMAPREIPENIRDFNDQLEYLLRPYGIMRRTVRLDRGWYREAAGPYLARRRSDGAMVAMLPGRLYGYCFSDPESGRRIRVGRKNEGDFEETATAFYRPFPSKKLTAADLLRYLASTVSASDILAFAAAVLAVTLIGMVTPRLQNFIFSTVLEERSVRLLTSAAVFLICAAVSQMLVGTVRDFLSARINTGMSVSVDAAAMMRIMSLPPQFFREYSSGELSGRLQYIGSLCDMLVSLVLTTGLTSLFSLIYITQIFAYAPALAAPALVITAVTVLFSVITSLVQMKVSKQSMEAGAKESGLGYAIISGIRKIKLAGAEKRAFAKWAQAHAAYARLRYDPPALIKYSVPLSMLISSAGMIVLYYAAVKSGISVADYYAFNTAYGMVTGAFGTLAGAALTAADIKPVFDMAKPILDAVPEVSEGKQVITRLSGGIELNNVTFRYSDSMPNVLENLSIKIRSGQYVAVVGATGCGKSTLMRLLLGFETPQRGAVYYDGRDLSTIDLRSLRRRIGVVLQDGKLFAGDIFSNITVSAPWLTMDEAWEAAETAGIADDIRAMPMGMYTMISEDSGVISGGQKQRLMIARAIAPKPKILMLDEATSALDNLTQKRISQSLAGLKCTRLVIAHRLSTIRQCDRIILLEKGRIIEDGTYDELIALGGRFASLVERQRLDIKDAYKG